MKKILSLTTLALALSASLATHALACNSLDDYNVKAINADKHQVTVAKGDTTQTFTTADKTKVTLDGKTASLSDLKSGDKVHIDYESNTDVLSITATRSS